MAEAFLQLKFFRRSLKHIGRQGFDSMPSFRYIRYKLIKRKLKMRKSKVIHMTISQMALIQSLGEAMSWFEREVSWGVPATELRHLCGRIGELFVAVITNGRMATDVNQKGYDVVSSANERISVKTTATVGSSGRVWFNSKTLSEVDRVVVLRINTEEREVEVLLDVPIAEAMTMMTPPVGGKQAIPLSKLLAKPLKFRTSKIISEVHYDSYSIRELENGSIEVAVDGQLVTPAKPVLRELAAMLNVGLLNSSGNAYNTRQLGGLVMKSLKELNASS